jgi:hypothetical protein
VIKARCPACDHLVPIRPGINKQAGRWVTEQHEDKGKPCRGGVL